MLFFPEIDEQQTKRNVKRKLKEYKRWREVARDKEEQNITQVLTFIPRGASGNPSRPVEKLVLDRSVALSELEAIEEAINSLYEPEHRYILIEKFLRTRPKSDYEIYSYLGYEKTRYFEIVDSAYLSFANLYRDCSLVVLKTDKERTKNGVCG